MKRGMPSMAALLGLLAVAGYQHRDKLSELLGGLGGDRSGGAGGTGTGAGGAGKEGLGGLLGGLGGLLGGASAGGVLSGGLGELLDRFKQSGHGEVAESWVGRGPNRSVTTDELERAVGSDVLDTLVERTGLSRQELLSRLSQTLPEAVDKFTPEGRLPTAEEAERFARVSGS